MTIPSFLLTTINNQGQVGFLNVGTYNWTVPFSVTSVSVVCIGGGASGCRGINNQEQPGGGGGGLRWITNMPVTPGETLTVYVGYGATAPAANDTVGSAGTWSYVARGATILISGNGGLPGTLNTVNNAGTSGGSGGNGSFDASLIGVSGITTGGGNGGSGGSSDASNNGGGGGAGGYSGNGGPGVNGSSNFVLATNGGSGGGGAGGEDGASTSIGGGGVGINTEGTSGSSSGAGGSSGSTTTSQNGGSYGGGGGGSDDNPSGSGANGAVRIIWGTGRSYPSTNTYNIN